MESDKNNRKYGHINYSTRLLGIAPLHWNFIMESPWEIKNLKVCKKPSQYTEGVMESPVFSALVDTAIVEKRINLDSGFDITSSIGRDSTPSSEVQKANPDNISNDLLSGKVEFEVKPDALSIDEKPICNTDAKEPKESPSGDKAVKYPPATRFVKQCLNHLLVKSIIKILFLCC